MKQLRKIADIEPTTVPPVSRRRPHQSGRLIQWLIETELAPAPRRLVERYQTVMVARLHPERALVELYVDPAAVSDNDRLMIELLFRR